MHTPDPVHPRRATNERRHRTADRRRRRDRRSAVERRHRPASRTGGRRVDTIHWLRLVWAILFHGDRRDRGDRRQVAERRQHADRRGGDIDGAGILTQEEIRFLLGKA